MRIVDTHLHLVDRGRFSYPWLAGVPALDRDWPPEDYFAEAASLGIEAALHMEVDVAEPDQEGETRHWLDADRRIVGAVAAAWPERDTFPALIERLAATARVKGIRRVLHTMPDELADAPAVVDNIRRLAAVRLPFDLCVLPRQHAAAARLAARCPDVQFVLDHCGIPDIAAGALDAWREGVTALSRLPNVATKISGIAAYAGPDWTAASLRPAVEHVIERFGWDRVVWGSDYPVCTLFGDLTRWVAATRELVADAGVDDQARLFSRNAERIYRL